MNFFEIYFKTALAVFIFCMFAFVGTLVSMGILGVPANLIFDFSLVCGLVCGFVPIIIKSLKKLKPL